MHFSTLVAAGGLFASVQAANNWIVSGAVWKTNSGQTIDAHGAMVLQEGNTFYLVGHAVSDRVTPYIYTSKDLRNWDLAPPDRSINYYWRPKFAKPNGQHFLFGQNNNRHVQALKSSSTASGYRLSGGAQKLPPNGYTYSDTGMFNEPGTNDWYLLTSADHNTVQINKINNDGSVGTRVNTLQKGAWEAPGILKVDGIYYIVVSDKTGYRNNPNKSYWTDRLNGGAWNGPSDIAPPSTNTYNSQNTFELTIKGTQATTYMYMGDSWVSGGGAGSTYIWLPIKVDTSRKTLTLQNYPQWKIDPVTGVVSTPSKKKRYEAEHAAVAGRAAIADCEHCMSKRSVNEISDDSTVTFNNIVGRGGPQWVNFHYRMANPEAGEAYVTLNDQVVHNISSLNTLAGRSDIVPIELDLQEGENKITFGMVRRGEDAGIVLDGIEVIEDEEE